MLSGETESSTADQAEIVTPSADSRAPTTERPTSPAPGTPADAPQATGSVEFPVNTLLPLPGPSPSSNTMSLHTATHAVSTPAPDEPDEAMLAPDGASSVPPSSALVHGPEPPRTNAAGPATVDHTSIEEELHPVIPDEPSAEPTRPVRVKKRPRDANEEYDRVRAPPTKLARSAGQTDLMPDHVLRHLNVFSAAHSTPEWADLLKCWSEIEQKRLGNSKGRFGTKGRPPCVTRWITKGRSNMFDANIGSIKEFGAQWWEWWNSHQPEGRAMDSDGYPLLEGDAATLRILGPNGLLSPIAALSWWAKAIVSPEETENWKRAVREVSWVLNPST